MHRRNLRKGAKFIKSFWRLTWKPPEDAKERDELDKKNRERVAKGLKPLLGKLKARRCINGKMDPEAALVPSLSLAPRKQTERIFNVIALSHGWDQRKFD